MDIRSRALPSTTGVLQKLCTEFVLTISASSPDDTRGNCTTASCSVDGIVGTCHLLTPGCTCTTQSLSFEKHQCHSAGCLRLGRVRSTCLGARSSRVDATPQMLRRLVFLSSGEDRVLDGSHGGDAVEWHSAERLSDVMPATLCPGDVAAGRSDNGG